ncbi:MAG: hydantoinase B/oxoprolinase family protein [Acidimicrobiia bacterium]|jgi:N-methylhydantoinase B
MADATNPALDPIGLEILRSRLETVAEQASLAIEHTAVSPAVTESKDYSVTLMDADGQLVLGAGTVLYHYAAASYSVRATIERHGDTIRDGDVFIANDPHNGGGLHPQDVMIQRPIYSGGRRIGWVGVSAHMMDMGGMVVGSFAPNATECFQEALRVPAVRLFREGVEVTEVWDIFRTNLRMAQLVEMDLRGLVAGCHFANERLSALVDAVGVGTFEASLRAIRDLTEAEMRRRVGLIADGTYRWTSWTEFDQDFYALPCTLTVDGDHLVFDFEGAAPQTDHFFNSKPYIVASELGVMLWLLMASDLPYNDGILAAFEVRCPEASIVNAKPPAPISAAHMHVGLNASSIALTALALALAASPDAPARRFVTATGGDSAIGNQVWAWSLPDGSTDAFIPFDGNWVGAPPGDTRDGLDLGIFARGVRSHGSFIDIEVLEAWFPLLVLERRTRRGADGAGRHRAGAGNHFSFRPHGVEGMHGTLFGMRRWLPLQGLAGGRPGSTAEMVVHRADGTSETFPVHTSGVRIEHGDWYEIRLPCAGGFGDPLDRDPDLVVADVGDGRFDADAALAVYGVQLDAAGVVDPAATQATRTEQRAARLRAASRAPTPVRVVPDGAADASEQPLYPGVVQRGPVAFAAASGTPLAIAPDHWTDGCPVITEDLWGDDGPAVTIRTYLDPATGRALHVEAVVGDSPRSFLVNPLRWSGAATE